MSDLVVLALANDADAIKMYDKLFKLKQERLIQLTDAVFVVRRADGKMKVKREVRLVGDDAYQGLLLDFVFWISWQELATGARPNAPRDQQGYLGVNDKFVKEISRIIELSHAALFLLAAKFSEDKLMDELQDFNATILKTSLSKEDEAMLKAAFGR